MVLGLSSSWLQQLETGGNEPHTQQGYSSLRITIRKLFPFSNAHSQGKKIERFGKVYFLGF